MAGGGPAAPSSEKPGPGAEHAELLRVLDARLGQSSVQGVAKEVLGADRSQKWDTDGGPRSKSRRRIEKAKAFMEERYREFLTPGGGGRRRPARRHSRES